MNILKYNVFMIECFYVEKELEDLKLEKQHT